MDGPPAHRPPHPTLSHAVVSTGAMTLASRVFGLVRDVLIGRIFGDTVVGSAFAAAFAIPNMFRRLFGEGALSAAFIPEYTGAHKTDRAMADRLACMVLWWLGVGTGLLTFVAELLLLVLLMTLPPDPERTLSLRLIMVMLPFMPLICVTAILAGMLQVHGKYAAAASGPVVLNAFIIAVGGYYVLFGGAASETVAYALGIATVLSGLTQALTFWWILRRSGVRWDARDHDTRAGVKRMLARFIPVLIGMGTLQLNAFLDTLIAMWPIWVGPTIFGVAYPLDDRSNIILSLTQRLYQFPLGVFGIAVATAAFPMLARHADDPREFVAVLRRGLRLSLLVGLPATIGLLLVRHDLVAVMFSGGKPGSGFSPEGVSRSAAVLAGFAVAVWAYAVNHVLTRAFYARGDTKTPMKLSLAIVGLNFLLNVALIWPLKEAGLAWSTAACAIIQCVVLAVLARRRFTPVGDSHLDGATIGAMARVAAASLLMGLAVWGLLAFWPDALSWREKTLRLAAATTTGIAGFVAACLVLRVQELRWLLHRRV